MCAQLFGRQNPDSNLWVDGFVSKWLRDSTLTCDTMAQLLTSQSSEKQRFARMMGSLSHVKKWLVLDGPMDDTWLENMGTLLDSTRALGLPNGESIAQPGEIITRTVGSADAESRITVCVFVFLRRRCCLFCVTTAHACTIRCDCKPAIPILYSKCKEVGRFWVTLCSSRTPCSLM